MNIRKTVSRCILIIMTIVIVYCMIPLATPGKAETNIVTTEDINRILEQYAEEPEETTETEPIIEVEEKKKAEVILDKRKQDKIEKYNLVPYDEPKKFYVNCYELNLRSKPSAKSKKTVVDTVKYNKKLYVLGSVKDSKFVYIGSEESPIFVSSKFLSKKKLPKLNQSATYNWSGQKLAKGVGTVQGPSGKETYYNMNMSGVVSIMRRMGNNDPYWVREDGCKMLGNYIMVAANLSIRPRGSIVPTSLGMGIVCDTGGFAYSNVQQLDLAVVWR